MEDRTIASITNDVIWTELARLAQFGYPAFSLGFYGDIENDEERFKVLDAAVELGATNWDTADMYGDSEELVGKWFKRTGKRDKIFLATKFGGTPQGVNGSPEYVKLAAAKALKTLGVDAIDLCYLIRADQKTPIEVTVGAFAELVKEGKIRYIGLSEVSADTLRRAHKVHPIAAVQVEYSPFFLDIEEEKIGLLKACRELGVAVVAYSPLGRGMLTGTYKSNADIPDGDWRKTVPKFSDENFPHILKLVEDLKSIGAKYNATAGQAALAWVLAQGDDIIPIPGTKKIKYLKENVAALNIKLTPEDIREIRKSAERASAVITGDRYASHYMDVLFTDTPPL